jgi:dienelactone hydrolase
MSIVLVSDVFGITPALLELSDNLGANIIVDPYKGNNMDFKDEAEAYSCFIKTVGLDNYLTQLLNTVKSLDSQTTLIGFSVGASIIWRLSENKDSNLIKQAFCFYGSQIRNFTHIEPCFKVSLILPKSEPHFDVSVLKEKLTKKLNVKATQVDYLHGFMNSYSTNFNDTAYKQYLAFLRATSSI